MGLKAIVRRAVPAGIWTKLFKLRHEVWDAWRDRKLTAERFARIGSPCGPLAGPFRGMRYLNEATGSDLFSKLLGTYELEIRDAIEWIVGWHPDVVVNVGCAEGYYAVGMARRCPDAEVVAFDIESRARKLVKQLAVLNDVSSHVAIRRKCTTENLEPLCRMPRKTAIIADCEGFEDFLLVPDQVPSLLKTVILVEVHDCFRPGLSERLRERFSRTHSILTITPRARTTADLPSSLGLGESLAIDLMDEGRSESCWMLMIPNPIAMLKPCELQPASSAPTRAA